MGNQSIELKIAEFKEKADSTQQCLTGMIETIEAGKVPAQEVMDGLNSDVSFLRTAYSEIMEMAASAMPEGGFENYQDGVYRVYEALETRVLQDRLDEIRVLLRRFIGIRSDVEAYAIALQPYQEKAKELLASIDEQEFETVEGLSAGPRAFMQIIDAQRANVSAAEKYNLVSEIDKYFPEKEIQFGLMGDSYIEAADDEEVSEQVDEQENVVEARVEEEAEVCPEDETPMFVAESERTEEVEGVEGLVEAEGESESGEEPEEPVEAETEIIEETEKLEDCNKAMLKVGQTPSDDVFCDIINKLLNREYKGDSFNPDIVDAVLLANGAALVEGRVDTESLSRELKLATRLLVENADYKSENLHDVFPAVTEDNKAMVLAAYMFAMLHPGRVYDHVLRQQVEYYFTNFKTHFDGFLEFRPLFSKLMLVWTKSQDGFTPIVIASLDDGSEIYLSNLCRKAEEDKLYTPPRAKMSELPKLYNDSFGKDSSLYECMTIIAENRKDENELVRQELTNYCDEQDGTFVINMEKVDAVVDEGWEKALNDVNKKTFKLTGAVRKQLIKNFTKRIDVMIKWSDYHSTPTDKIDQLKSLRNQLIDEIKSLRENSSWKNSCNANVLDWMLCYMSAYLLGKLNSSDIYFNLVRRGIIGLDKELLPIIDEELTAVMY